MKDKTYINIPIGLLKLIHNDIKTFCRLATRIGVWKFAEKFEYGDDFQRYEDALKKLGIRDNDPIQGVLEAQYQIKNITTKACAGIETHILYDFFENDKKEFQLACLAAYCAIHSIIGRKPYWKTNKQHIHARMFGYDSIKDLQTELTDLEKKYQKRWNMDKVLNELEYSWHLRLWSGRGHFRGLYVSFTVNIEVLINQAEQSTQKAKLNKLRQSKQAVYKQVKERNRTLRDRQGTTP